MRLTDLERAELMALSKSESMREDSRRVSAERHNPFLIDGGISMERVVDFLTQYNEFFNHPIKPFTQPIEDNMKL